ncbi:MAG: hypothetical protein FWH34_06700 [Desulfovibrionaceae bacterium]|nr:hypothetical protein [Desulfovibrionaceae bacterium]
MSAIFGFAANPQACSILISPKRKVAAAMIFTRISMNILHFMHQWDKILCKASEAPDV